LLKTILRSGVLNNCANNATESTDQEKVSAS